MRGRKRRLWQWIYTVINMVDINPNISKITLNVNGLYTPIKSQRLSEWIKKTTNYMLSVSNSL